MKTKREKIDAILEAAKGNFKPLHSGTLPKCVIVYKIGEDLYKDASPEGTLYTEAELELLNKRLSEAHPDSVLIRVITPTAGE